MNSTPRKRWMAEIGAKARTPTAAHARRTTPAVPVPSGGGLTSERLRERLVERLRGAGIRDEVVLAAIKEVPRHRFVDEALASRAYEDTALPIGEGQTISQPYVVARMCELVRRGGRRLTLLEVGTGCGYQAAVMAHLADTVYSIERIRALHDRARANLRPLRIANLRLVYGDGMMGLPETAPFDGMIIAAAAESLPQVLLDQLAIGARAVAPLGGAEQSLCVIERTGPSTFKREVLEAVRFVPLLPGRR